MMSAVAFSKLRRSIGTFGMVEPLVVRRADHTIIGGHQRLEAAKALGMTEVPVVYVEVTEDEAKVLNLALNRISGDWDAPKLGALLEELRELPTLDETLSGFDQGELDQLLADLERQQQPNPFEESFDLAAEMLQAQQNSAPARDAMLIFMAVDPAISQAATADYFALVVLGMNDDRNIWVLDTYRERLDFPAQIEIIKSKAAQWDPDRIPIEDSAYQLSLVQALMRESSLPVVRSKSAGDKTARIMAMGPHFENGRIRVRRGMRELEAEYLAFPRGAHDDLLDALEKAVEAACERGWGPRITFL
jgi:predicted phage terminase large subunit-like protein